VYEEFISNRKLRQHLVKNGERHHIIPRGVGGGDEKSNLILLTWATDPEYVARENARLRAMNEDPEIVAKQRAARLVPGWRDKKAASHKAAWAKRKAALKENS
jgi:hypothetical protein